MLIVTTGQEQKLVYYHGYLILIRSLKKQISTKMNNKNTLKLAFGQTINQIKVNDTLKNGRLQSSQLI